MTPLVTIILPNYNHASYLRNRIENVLNQTYQNFELIILDDCSSDNSVDIINEYRGHPKIKSIILNTKNSGSTFKQWMTGFDLASDFVWIAESDDVNDMDFLKTCMRVIIENNSDIVFANSHMIDSEGKIIGDLNWWFQQFSKYDYSRDFTVDSKEYIKNALSFNNSIMNASSVVFKLNKNIDISSITNFKLCGDWFFWISHLSFSSKISYVADKLNYYRFHNNSVRAITDKSTIVLYEAMKVRTFCIQKFSLSKEYKKNIVKEVVINFKSVIVNLFNQSLYLKIIAVLYNMFRINTFLTIRVIIKLLNNKICNVN